MQRFTRLIITGLLFFLSIMQAHAQGLETFDNLHITGTSYQSGQFEGQDGSTWTFVNCRGDMELNGKAITLGRNQSPQAYFQSGSIPGGLGFLSFSYMQTFGTNVNLNVYVNDQLVGHVSTSGQQNEILFSDPIEVQQQGDIVLKFISVHNSSGQVTVDDISWSAYGEDFDNAENPVLVPTSGVFYDDLEVSLHNPAPQATMYYSTESENGPWTVYNEPFTIAATPQEVSVWAYATQPGLYDSEVVQSTYTFRNKLLHRFIESTQEDIEDQGWSVFDTDPHANSWHIHTFAGDYFAQITEYESNPPYPESWFISPAMVLSEDLESVWLSFLNTVSYKEGQALSVKISTDYSGHGDPGQADWNPLQATWDSPQQTHGQWTHSGFIDMGSYVGETVHVAFHYLSDPSNLGRWRIDDIIVSSNWTESSELIDLSVDVLPSFRQVWVDTRSDIQFYDLQASGLSEPLYIQADSPLEISLSCHEGFGQSLEIQHQEGIIPATRIFVRAAPESIQAFHPSLHHHSGSEARTLSTYLEGIHPPIPSDYYSSATATGSTLKTQLHEIINNHTVVSYASIWTHFHTTDATFDDKVWDIFSDTPCDHPAYVYNFGEDQDAGYGGNQKGDFYNREHSFPRSWFGGNTSPMWVDIHHIYPVDKHVNAVKADYPLGVVNNPTWVSTNGSRVGTNSLNGYNGIAFEPIDAYKGDLARAYLYMITRYENQIENWTYNEYGMAMLDNQPYPGFEPWVIDMFLLWHALDPVSQKERARNDAIFAIQGNRNPFIDKPHFVEKIWGDTTLTAPNNLNRQKISIWPNPASQWVKVEAALPILELKIFNTSGLPMAMLLPGESKTRFSVAHWNPGVYLIHVKTTKHTDVQKLIIY